MPFKSERWLLWIRSIGTWGHKGSHTRYGVWIIVLGYSRKEVEFVPLYLRLQSYVTFPIVL